MEDPHILYNQSATHLTLPLYLRPETEVEPHLIAELADFFLSNLLFPGTRVTTLHTKWPGMGARLNMGDFTPSRWKAAQKKIRNGEFAVVQIHAETPDFPRQKIWLSVHVNPIGGNELLDAGTITVRCSVSYLRHLAVSRDKTEALLNLVKLAWNRIPGGAAYGYGNLALTLARPVFDPSKPRFPAGQMPWDFVKPPDQRAHAVPIAYVGNDIELNLASLYCKARGIKGAFWANFLSAAHVSLAGGEAVLRRELNGLRIDRLEHDGLLIVATDSPLPEDTAETRSRFVRLDEGLRPAFLSRDETPELKRGMLGYFYRERPPLR